MKVLLLAALSLDGKIAAHAGQSSLDWTSPEDKAFFARKTREAGAVVMGRRTHEMIGRPLPGRLNVVMTRAGAHPDDRPGAVEHTADPPGTIVARLDAAGFDQVAVVGGAEVYALWLASGLVTDLFLTIEPLLFGGGVPFVAGIDPLRLRLVSREALGSGATLLHLRLAGQDGKEFSESS